jgi:hypothetical protein
MVVEVIVILKGQGKILILSLKTGKASPAQLPLSKKL